MLLHTLHTRKAVALPMLFIQQNLRLMTSPFRNAPKGYGRCIDHLIYAEQIISCLNFPIIAMQGQTAPSRQKQTF